VVTDKTIASFLLQCQLFSDALARRKRCFLEHKICDAISAEMSEFRVLACNDGAAHCKRGIDTRLALADGTATQFAANQCPR